MIYYEWLGVCDRKKGLNIDNDSGLTDSELIFAVSIFRSINFKKSSSLCRFPGYKAGAARRSAFVGAGASRSKRQLFALAHSLGTSASVKLSYFCCFGALCTFRTCVSWSLLNSCHSSNPPAVLISMQAGATRASTH